MQIQIENIGKIKSAKLFIPSIAVIAGENNTGKSTISKSIYSFFQGTKDMEDAFLKEQFESLEFEYYRLKAFFYHKQTKLEEKQFVVNIERIETALTEQNHETIISEINSLKEKASNITSSDDEKKSILFELENFSRKLSVDVTSNSYKFHYLEQVYNQEFSNSICSTYVNHVSGTFSYKNNHIVFKENKLDTSNSKIEHFKNLGSIYIDNPFIVDDISRISPRRFSLPLSNSLLDHNSNLRKLLRQTLRERTIFDDYINTDKFNTVFGEVLNGSIKIENKMVQYIERKTGAVYPLSNLATGMKSFFILQQLIESGELQRNDILILDEPEIHLHPIWQLKYAELIILISIQFNLKVLVTSHSPYFIEAIEQFSKKHQIVKEVKYYRTINTSEGNILKDVTDDLPSLYTDFSLPFIELEKMRDEYEDVD